MIKASLPKELKLLYSTYLTEYVYRKWKFDGVFNGANFLCFLQDIAKIYWPDTDDKPKEVKKVVGEDSSGSGVEGEGARMEVCKSEGKFSY